MNNTSENSTKLDQIIELLQQQNHRIDRLEKRFDDSEKRMDQRFDDSEKKLDQRFDDFRKEMDQRFELVNQRVTDEANKLHKKIRIEIGEVQSTLLRYHFSQARKIESLEEGLRAFREELLTTMDVVRKEYDASQENSAMTSSALDRQQKELHAYNAKNDEAFSELYERLEKVEAAVA